MKNSIESAIQYLNTLPEKSEGSEELLGNVSELSILVQGQSKLVSKWACYLYRWGGIKDLIAFSSLLSLANVGKYSAITLRHYALAWEKYHDLFQEFPRLSFSFFLQLQHWGIKDLEKARHILGDAESHDLTLSKMREAHGGKRKEKHICPSCGQNHSIKEHV